MTLWTKGLHFLSNVAMVGVGPIAQLLTISFVAHSISLDDLGLYFAIISVLPILQEFVGISSSEVLIKRTIHDPKSFGRWYGQHLVLVGLTLPLSTIAYVLLISATPSVSSISYGSLALLAILDSIGGRALAASEHMAMAHRLHGLGNFWRTLGPVARLLFVGGYIFFGGAHDAFAIAMAGSTAAMIAGLIGYLVSAMKFGRPLLSRPEGMMEYALFSLNQMGRASLQNSDRYILSFVLSPSSLGIYSVAMRLAQAGLLPLQIVQRRLFPEYFVHGAQGFAAVVNFGVRNLWVQVAAALVAVTGILILAPILVQIFDVSSDDGVTVTRIVSITLVLYAIFYVAADILTGSGRQFWRSVAIMSAAVLQIPLMLWTATTFGIVGAAWGSVLSIGVATLLSWVIVAFFLKEQKIL